MTRVLRSLCNTVERLMSAESREIHTHLTMCSSPCAKVLTLPHPGQDGWNEQVQAACNSLRQNNVIAVPTDTIYGIAGLAQSTEAIRKIYQIKHRSQSNPISISVGDVSQVASWGRVTISNQLLEELLPGPVTVVFERTLALNHGLNPGTSLVGIRVPNDGFVQEVARQCGEPLALTSANPSGASSTLSVNEFECLWPELDLVFDGGVLGSNKESRSGSTVVDLSCSGLFTIIRPGMAHHRTKETLLKYGLQEKIKGHLI